MMTLEDCRAFYSQEIRLAANLTTPGLVEAFAHVPRPCVSPEDGRPAKSNHYDQFFNAFQRNGLEVGAQVPTSDSSRLSVFTATQEQLGLKLEPQTRPVEFLMIDQAERPTEN